jgi:hypothetical protein
LIRFTIAPPYSIFFLIESYAHFCDHFRERPGTNCTRCKKCDLYKTAPDDEAVQAAATKAKSQYLKAHPEVAVVAPHTVIGPKNTLDKLGNYNGILCLHLLFY